MENSIPVLQIYWSYVFENLKSHYCNHHLKNETWFQSGIQQTLRSCAKGDRWSSPLTPVSGCSSSSYLLVRKWLSRSLHSRSQATTAKIHSPPRLLSQPSGFLLKIFVRILRVIQTRIKRAVSGQCCHPGFYRLIVGGRHSTKVLPQFRNTSFVHLHLPKSLPCIRARTEEIRTSSNMDFDSSHFPR